MRAPRLPVMVENRRGARGGISLRLRRPAILRMSVVLSLVVLLVVIPVPAHAYGDPTGGALFQILGTLFALAWGAWLIFANSVRRHVGNLVKRIRGSKAPDSQA